MNYNTENENLSRETGRGRSPTGSAGAPFTQGGQREEAEAKPSYWAVLPAAIRYDPEIPANAKLLYAEISSLTDARGYCWASNAYFERLYDLSERTIVRLIRALEKAGYIRILDAGGGSARRKIAAGINPLGTSGGERIATAACALPRNDGDGEPSAPPDKNVSTPLTKMSVPPDKNVTQIKKEIKKKNEPPKAPQGAAWEPEMFERFWKLYPRKRDKLKALRAWDKLKADRKLMQTMSAALKAQMATEEWQRDNGRAIPYPSTWINNRRWEDELEEPMAAAEPPREEALPWI